MIELKSIKADHKVLEIIKRCRRTRIDSIFENALNILFGNDLITIIDKSWGYIPLGITASIKEVIGFNVMNIKPDSKIKLSPEKIIIDNKLKICLTDCIWLNNKIDRKNIDRSLVRNNLDVIKGYIENNKTDYGLVSIIDNIDSIIVGIIDNNTGTDPLKAKVIEVLGQFFKQFKKNNIRSAVKKLECIVGLGQGTTPSGDDIILGIIVSLYYIEPIWVEEVKGLRDRIKGKTTRISEKYLLQAIEGNISESLTNYMEELLYGKSRDKLLRSVADLIKVGASSGKEIILGSILAVEFYLKFK